MLKCVNVDLAVFKSLVGIKSHKHLIRRECIRLIAVVKRRTRRRIDELSQCRHGVAVGFRIFASRGINSKHAKCDYHLRGALAAFRVPSHRSKRTVIKLLGFDISEGFVNRVFNSFVGIIVFSQG